MMLLVKTEGRWRIISQAWDNEAEARPIPADLLIQIDQAKNPSAQSVARPRDVRLPQKRN